MNNSNSMIEELDYAKIRDNFCRELQLATEGGKTSLPFIKNPLPDIPLVAIGEKFQAFVIGGTKGSVATVEYRTNKTIQILTIERFPLLPKFATKDDFLDFLRIHIQEETRVIAINLAAELLPFIGMNGELDGILMEGATKRHAYKDLQKEKVGKTIEEFFHNKIIASVANDTVCVLAAAIEKDINKDHLAAGIVGTGYNMGFFLNDMTIINVQSSDFHNFTPTESGRIVDGASTNKGERLYSKEIAAGDLYKHYNALIPILNLKPIPFHSTEELAISAESNIEKEGLVANQLFHRSASLVAAHFAGLYRYKQSPPHLTFIMDGSMFWEKTGYKEIVAEQLLALGVPEGTITFKQIAEGDILGAAKLVTG